MCWSKDNLMASLGSETEVDSVCFGLIMINDLWCFVGLAN